MLLAYSARNRSASCRIPYTANPKAKRVEVRFPDPAANPYLAFAAMLMAGLDGITNKLDPGARHGQGSLRPAEAGVGADPRRSAARCGKHSASLQADHAYLTAGGVFTEDLIESYIELKMTEVMRFEMDPAPGRIRDVLLGLTETRWSGGLELLTPEACYSGSNSLEAMPNYRRHRERSEATQPYSGTHSGLLRRYAPRNDESQSSTVSYDLFRWPHASIRVLDRIPKSASMTLGEIRAALDFSRRQILDTLGAVVEPWPRRPLRRQRASPFARRRPSRLASAPDSRA